MVQKYLYVKQSCISRWQYSSPNDKAFGLYTEGFLGCIVILLRSKDKSRIVMLHADILVTLDDIKKEIEWCGKDCEKNVYYKEHRDAATTVDDIFGEDHIKQDFTFNLIKALRKNGKIIEDKDSPLYEGQYIPEFEAISIHMDF